MNFLPLFILVSIANAGSCFSFKTQNGWYKTAEVNYRLEQLPNTLVIDCDSSDVKCSAQDNGLSYNNAMSWLQQHWNRLEVNDGRACAISEMGPSITASFECKMLHSDDPWSSPDYDAKHCKLHLYNSLGPGPVICFTLLTVFFFIYLFIVFILLRVEKKHNIKIIQLEHPRLRTTLSLQVGIFFLIYISISLAISRYFSIDNTCKVNAIEDDILLFVVTMCTILTTFISAIFLAIASTARKCTYEEETDYFPPIRRCASA